MPSSRSFRNNPLRNTERNVRESVILEEKSQGSYVMLTQRKIRCWPLPSERRPYGAQLPNLARASFRKSLLSWFIAALIVSELANSFDYVLHACNSICPSVYTINRLLCSWTDIFPTVKEGIKDKQRAIPPTNLLLSSIRSVLRSLPE